MSDVIYECLRFDTNWTNFAFGRRLNLSIITSTCANSIPDVYQRQNQHVILFSLDFPSNELNRYQVIPTTEPRYQQIFRNIVWSFACLKASIYSNDIIEKLGEFQCLRTGFLFKWAFNSTKIIKIETIDCYLPYQGLY